MMHFLTEEILGEYSWSKIWGLVLQRVLNCQKSLLWYHILPKKYLYSSGRSLHQLLWHLHVQLYYYNANLSGLWFSLSSV